MYNIGTIGRQGFIMKRKKIHKEELETLLEVHGSVGKVAVFLGIPYSTLYSWYKKDNIPLPPSCMNMYDELRSLSFSGVQRSVALGSVLGDGSLLKGKRAKNARLQIGHCTKQLGYLKWKKDLLAPFSRRLICAEKPGPKVIGGKNSYTTGYYFMNTIAHPDITEYYNKYYFRGKKRVHQSVLEEMDLLSLAIWLADDGSFSERGKHGVRGSIATNSFYYDETEILLESLFKFYKGHASIANDGSNIIYMSGSKAIVDLLKCVTEILPECIHYKFAPQRLHAKPPM